MNELFINLTIYAEAWFQMSNVMTFRGTLMTPTARFKIEKEWGGGYCMRKTLSGQFMAAILCESIALTG